MDFSHRRAPVKVTFSRFRHIASLTSAMVRIGFTNYNWSQSITCGFMSKKLESCLSIQQDLGTTIPVPSLATWKFRESVRDQFELKNKKCLHLVHERASLFKIFVAFHPTAAHLMTRLKTFVIISLKRGE